MRFNLGDLGTGVGFVLFNEEEKVELNSFNLIGRWWDGLGVDLVFDAVYLAREHCLYEKIIYIVLEIGLRYVYDTLFIGRPVICRFNLFISMSVYLIHVD